MRNNKKAFLPGSYDPITSGHLDIIRLASKMFDEICVVCAQNPDKKYMFTPEQRLSLIKDAIKNVDNASAVFYEGYLIDFAHQNDNFIIVKGIRNSNDLEYENKMAKFNKEKCFEKYGKNLETVYIEAKDDYKDISSTTVRQKLMSGQDLSDLVPNQALLNQMYESNKE